MGPRVNVTSVEAIESFRASLIVYLAKARATLDEVATDVARTRSWVQYNQRVFWQEAVKNRKQRLDEAQQVLLGSKMSKLRNVSASEQMAVAKAKRALDEAESKLRVIRHWDREIETQTDPLVRQMEKLQSVLGDDMIKAVAYLTQALKALNEYTGMIAPSIETSGVGDKKPAATTEGTETVIAENATQGKGGAS